MLGKGDCDSQGGIDKNYCRQFFRTKAIPEVDMGKIKCIEACTVTSTGKKKSLTQTMYDILADPIRTSGMKGHTKHAKREAAAAIQNRSYHVMDHNLIYADDINAPVLCANTKFAVTGGFIKGKKKEKNNGIMAHYHFYADYCLGIGKVMARRIPCSCESCHTAITSPWDDTIDDPALQQKFQNPVNCKYRSVFGGFNAWKLLHLSPTNDAQEDEIAELFDDILVQHEANASREIENGQFGAHETADGFDIIRWTSDAYSLETDRDDIEGCHNPLPAGSIVARGIYWNPVGRANQWYTPPPYNQSQERIFRVRYVVSPRLEMEPPSDTVKLPPGLRGKDRILQMNPMHLTDASLQQIHVQVATRAMLDFEETMQGAEDVVVAIDDSDAETDMQEEELEEEDTDEE